MTALVELAGITKTLRGQQEPRTVLAGVDLTVHNGESVAILGRSGSGKSTLLSLIGLFDRADDGRYLLGARDITRVPERKAAALRSSDLPAPHHEHRSEDGDDEQPCAPTDEDRQALLLDGALTVVAWEKVDGTHR